MTANDKWFLKSATHQKSKFRLFCFPFAGGSVSLYHRWQEAFADDFEIVPVCLPGRDRRFAEPAIDQMSDLISKISRAINPHLDMPFAFFGYSMGGKIAHHLASHLAQTIGISPDHLFIAASQPPGVKNTKECIHDLSPERFWEEVADYGGTPQEILDNPEYRELFEPQLRADFKLSECTDSSNLPPLQSPITVFGGTGDPRPTPADLDHWQNATLSTFEKHVFDGGHFFIHQHIKEVHDVIKNTVSRYLPA